MLIYAKMSFKILFLQYIIYTYQEKKLHENWSKVYENWSKVYNCLGKVYPIIFQRKQNHNPPEEPSGYDL